MSISRSKNVSGKTLEVLFMNLPDQINLTKNVLYDKAALLKPRLNLYINRFYILVINKLM